MQNRSLHRSILAFAPGKGHFNLHAVCWPADESQHVCAGQAVYRRVGQVQLGTLVWKESKDAAYVNNRRQHFPARPREPRERNGIRQSGTHFENVQNTCIVDGVACRCALTRVSPSWGRSCGEINGGKKGRKIKRFPCVVCSTNTHTIGFSKIAFVQFWSATACWAAYRAFRCRRIVQPGINFNAFFTHTHGLTNHVLFLSILP